MSNVKQVIVMRKDLGMRKGKMIAQGAHASIGSLLTYFSKLKYTTDIDKSNNWIYECRFKEGSVLDQWLNGSFTKICVSVNSEEELLDVYKKAKKANLPCKLITDSGLTEFNGIPTNTCVGVGPFLSEEIDKITGNLPLL